MSDRMEKYLAPLVIRFESAGNIQRAEGAKKYMKDHFDFLGIDAATRRQIQSEYLRTNGYPSPDQFGEFALYLWSMPFREYQHATLDILHKQEKKLRKEDITWIEGLITEKSWWDTVDCLASWICGTYFKKFPEQIKPVTGKWIDSGNIWLQRTCLLFQLKYKLDVDTQLLADYIRKLSGHKEFFIRKAIGWILREYSKINPAWVRSFVDESPLSGLSYREATKYI
jgi:3-methyladenine DNA glycosylase AlkD